MRSEVGILVILSEGDGFRTVAMHDVPRAFADKAQTRAFFHTAPGSPVDHIVRTRRAAHIADITDRTGLHRRQ